MFVDTAINSELYSFYIFFICTIHILFYAFYSFFICILQIRYVFYIFFRCSSTIITHALKIQLRYNEYSVQIVLIFALLPTFLLVFGSVGVLR